MNDMQFLKYKTRGVGYHWEQMSKSIRKRNIYVVARYELILDLIKDDIGGKKILDLGCGDGALSYLLGKGGANVTGVDSLGEVINFAKQKCKNIGNINFLVVSAYKLPFEDEEFDYIISSDVIEHLSYPGKMLFEIKRVWNRKGEIVITTPIKFTEKPLDKMHYQEFFENEFEQLLEKHFENIKTIKSHPLFWMEFQNKSIFRRSFFKCFFNLLNLAFGFNPFKYKGKWRYYTLQTAIISE